VRTETSRLVFGAFDGLTSLVGVLAGLLAAHTPPLTVLAATVGLAIASAVGMASGDYLSAGSPRGAAVMGGATLAGSAAPAVPVALLPGWPGLTVAGVLAVGIVVGISELRATARGRVRSYATTLAVLVASGGLAAAASLGLGVAS
jgi:hypothetical protein